MFDIFILILAGLLYFIRILIFSYGSNKERHASYPKYNEYSEEFISVIIPARNEENNIERCILSLLDSDYSLDKFEIIVVNDRSEDKTLEIIELYADKIQIVNIENNNTDKNLQGKVGAIQAGIDMSKGEILMFTDADCRVDKSWIKTFSQLYKETQSDMIASFTLIDGKNLFDKVQAVEWVMIHTMASGEVGSGSPYGCFGNNVSFRKSSYNSIGGYKNIDFSITEDLALMQAMHKNNKEIIYICNPNAVVYTKPEKNINDFLNQQKRWAMGGKALKWKATLYISTSILIWLSIIINLIFANYNLMLITIFIKILGDLIVLIPSLKELNLSKYYLFSIPTVFIFMLLELVIPLLLLDNKVVWKGQEFKG